MSEATIRPEDIRWRVGQISKKDAHKGSLLGYIDARTCMEALDALDPEWSAVHGDPIIVGGELVGVPCTVTVNGVRRSDVGMPSSQEPIKGAYSDALKRAAVHFGIGRELYELPRIYVKLDDYKKPIATPTYRNGRWTLPSGSGSVFYDREPDDTLERGEQARAGSRPAASAPVPKRTAEQQMLRNLAIDAAAKRFGDGYQEAARKIADEVGVPAGQEATVEQLREIISRIEQPPAQEAAGGGEGDARASSSPTDAPEPVDPPVDVAPAPTTMDEILAVTGGEEVPPDRDSDPAAYRAWFDAQSREKRAELRAAGLSPKKAVAA